jgi:hypothetical protein
MADPVSWEPVANQPGAGGAADAQAPPETWPQADKVAFQAAVQRCMQQHQGRTSDVLRDKEQRVLALLHAAYDTLGFGVSVTDGALSAGAKLHASLAAIRNARHAAHMQELATSSRAPLQARLALSGACALCAVRLGAACSLRAASPRSRCGGAGES